MPSRRSRSAWAGHHNAASSIRAVWIRKSLQQQDGLHGTPAATDADGSGLGCAIRISWDVGKEKGNKRSVRRPNKQRCCYVASYILCSCTTERRAIGMCSTRNGKVSPPRVLAFAINTGSASRNAPFYYLWCLPTIRLPLSCQEKWKAAVILYNRDLFIEGSLVL